MSIPYVPGLAGGPAAESGISLVDGQKGILEHRGIPSFAVSRAAGWWAHWIEQPRDTRIFRPRRVHAGGHDLPYVPIEERG